VVEPTACWFSCRGVGRRHVVSMSTSLLDVSPSRHKLQTTPLPPPSLGYHNNISTLTTCVIQSGIGQWLSVKLSLHSAPSSAPALSPALQHIYLTTLEHKYPCVYHGRSDGGGGSISVYILPKLCMD